jgi:hypothetical protein
MWGAIGVGYKSHGVDAAEYQSILKNANFIEETRILSIKTVSKITG